MNRALGHFCAHTGKIGPEEPPEDGEMSEMTLPTRQGIRNSNTGGLKRGRYLSVREVPRNSLKLIHLETEGSVMKYL